MNYLESAKRQFTLYKQLCEKAMAQLSDEALFWQPDPESNSIAIIIKHLWGNMLSRWTDFLTTDGEKDWRRRDEEFENDAHNREELMIKWEAGWQCLFNALDSITDQDLEHTIYIRNDGHTILEAINRQVSHYAYHAGQIVYIAKMVAKDNWHTLSIARNKSRDYNAGKFAQEKELRDFSKDLLK
jgi:hypothetical protein